MQPIISTLGIVFMLCFVHSVSSCHEPVGCGYRKDGHR